MADAFAASLTVRAIGWALVQSLWQGAIVGVLTAFALLALRRSAASLRYTVACLGMATLVAVPVVTAVLHAREARTNALRQDIATPVFVGPEARAIAVSEPVFGESSNLPAPGATGWWPGEQLEEWSVVAVPLWLLGVLALSVTAGCGLARRRASPPRRSAAGIRTVALPRAHHGEQASRNAPGSHCRIRGRQRSDGCRLASSGDPAAGKRTHGPCSLAARSGDRARARTHPAA